MKQKKKDYGIKSKFDKKKDLRRKRISTIIDDSIEKSGLETTATYFNKKLIIATATIMFFVSAFIVYNSIYKDSSVLKIIIALIAAWAVMSLIVYVLVFLITAAFLDVKVYKRTQQIEEVLPDFLQLTSANISAGMTIDRALWFAVRPRFGVLAKEMEEIAKATTAGEDLEQALLSFSKKYDSRILKESISLLIAGINAGGEIGELLNKIASNIEETKLMKKEISASVTTYVIFIAAASILAAPLLYALSAQLLEFVKSIAVSTSSTSSTAGPALAGGISLKLSGDGIAIGDFRIFSYVLISITNLFSAAIISTIRKGRVKDGLKNIPIYIILSLIVYWVASLAMGALFSGIL